MANYSIIANSTFQPFTYQELALPLDRQEAYQEKLEEEYEKLSTQADVLEAMGSNDRDKASGAYGKYKAYSDALKKEADDLYRFGLNTESRQRLTDLRRKYNTDIVPIQNAWTKREQEANDQMKATLANPSLMFTRDARNSTLDDYLRNPTGGYGVISGANITAQMASMAGQLAKQVRSGRRENIDSYTYNYIEKYGLDENLIRNWRNSPTLTKMFEQVMQANGVTPEALEGSMNADSIISKSTNYAEMGMWNAMGEDKAQIRENYGARLAAQKAAELDNYWQKKQMDAYFAGGGTGDGPTYPGETYKLNFNDAANAGANMKHRMAEATVKYMQDRLKRNPNDELANKFLEFVPRESKIQYGNWAAATKHLETNGLDGSDEWLDTKNRRLLNNYLKTKVTKDDELVNLWTSPYEKTNLIDLPVSSGLKKSPATYLTFGIPATVASLIPTSNSKKNWGDFDKLSSNGYYVNAIQLKDKPAALSSWLSGVISRNGNGKINLYDIKGIDANNNYTYSQEGTAYSDLPKKADGDIDYSKMHRSMLSNGDFVIYWLDSDGNTIEKILKRSDIGHDAQRAWNNVDNGYKRLLKMYSRGEVSPEEFETLSKRFGVKNMQDAYLMLQDVDIQDEKIQ